jgi:para-nitrobenzyl esterase
MNTVNETDGAIATGRESSARIRDAIVEISTGKVRGTASDAVHAFKGIPYGASTGGAGSAVDGCPRRH